MAINLRGMPVKDTLPQVGAPDLARVRPAGRARIRLEAVPGVVFEGRVASVAEVARE